MMGTNPLTQDHIPEDLTPGQNCDEDTSDLVQHIPLSHVPGKCDFTTRLPQVLSHVFSILMGLPVQKLTLVKDVAT